MRRPLNWKEFEMGLRAGAARQQITPTGFVPMFGHPDSKRISTGVHDPLWVSALHLRTGEISMVLITLDVLFLEPATIREIRDDIVRKTSVRPDAIFISCTHNHSGPVTSRMLAWELSPGAAEPDPAYIEALKESTLQAAAHAMATTRPAELAYTTVPSGGMGGNRFSPDGESDEPVGVISVREPRGDAIAVVLVHAMHPTITPKTSTEISSDFPHYVREQLREDLGEEVIVLYHVGACADQSPCSSIAEHSFAEAERFGRALASEVRDGIKGLDDDQYDEDVNIVTKRTTVNLNRAALPSNWDARVTQGDRRAERQRLAEGADIAAQCAADDLLQGANGTLALLTADQRGEIDTLLKSYQPFEIDAIRFNDLVLVGLPGEMGVSLAQEIRTRSDCPVFVASLANGNLQGYVLSKEDAGANRYGPASSIFGSEASVAMIDKTVALIQSL